jgi:microfibrillar-associated protein 1
MHCAMFGITTAAFDLFETSGLILSILDFVIGMEKGFKGKEAPKVKRYWPGKAPVFEPFNEDNGRISSKEKAKPVVVDRRMQRLQSMESVDQPDSIEPVRRRRPVDEGEVVSQRTVIASNSEDMVVRRPRTQILDDEGQIVQRNYKGSSEAAAHDEEKKTIDTDVPTRRRRLPIDEDVEEFEFKEVARDLQEPGPVPLASKISVQPTPSTQRELTNETETDEESGVESDSLSEEEAIPVFIPKNKRVGIIGLEQQAEQEKLEIEMKKLQAQERVVGSRKMVAETVNKEQNDQKLKQALDDQDSGIDDVDDTDDVDMDAEFEAWKQREFARIRKERDTFKQFLADKVELERRRNLTDEQRRKEDLAAGIDRFKKDKGSMKFLQKYYHKGAFFADQDILKRDFTAPTGEDNFNKEALPEVLQKKKVGMRSQTKYTHLVDQDTSKGALWNMGNVKRKMGGVGDLDSQKKQRNE